MKKPAVLLLSTSMVVGWQSGYFAATEKVGYTKSDILVDRVEYARDAQVEAKDKITDVLTEFRKVVNSDGGELEVRYQSLATQLEES
jgi:hypothetical protein